MSAHLLAPSEPQLEATELSEALEDLLAKGSYFWLDLFDPSYEEFEMLRSRFGFHPLAVEASEHFGQRPKADEYEDFVFLVIYGYAPDEDGLVEVHCFYSDHFLVTVRRDESPAIEGLSSQFRKDPARCPQGALLLHQVLDRLVDDFFPALEAFDTRLDLIEEHMFASPKPEHLQDAFRIKRRLVRLRRVIAPERDLVGRIVSGSAELPGMTQEAERYFRDVYDHLIRLTEEVDGGRELSNSTIDAYLSTASNRLNATTKQLTVIATIFLPLSFLTGFFGQNFGWMVGEVSSWQAFVLLGIGLEVLMVIGLLILFRVRRWF